MRIAVVGVGLIGGSIGLAARERLGGEVSGWDASESALAAGVDRGALDHGAAALADAVRDAEAAFVAVPVGVLAETVNAVLAAAPDDCVVTDVGSTKRLLAGAHADQRFVGGHPLAGAETSGVEHARADLFDGATWYLTLASTTSGMLLERVHRLLTGLGARPAAIEAETHDTILALVSHLPHVLANVLVTQAAETLTAEGERLPATGPSFRDATRVAGAPNAIWSDIYMANRDALVPQIDAVLARLTAVRASLAAGDRGGIEAWNAAAGADRRRVLERGLAGGELHELRVGVANRPGIVAEIALALGRVGVNIADLALYPAPDMTEGVVALWVEGSATADRAAAILGDLDLPVYRP